VAKAPKRGARADVVSEYYKVFTPKEVPLEFCSDGFYRLAADAECVKCGFSFPQVLRCDRFRTGMGIIIPDAAKPDPSAERVMTSFMLAVCKNGLGKPHLHKKGCPHADPSLAGRYQLTGIRAQRYFGGAPAAPKGGR
jgi:hypothetical protein